MKKEKKRVVDGITRAFHRMKKSENKTKGLDSLLAKKLKKK